MTKGISAQFLRGGLGTFTIKVGNLVAAFGLVVLLARLLGPEGYGVYSYVLALVTLLGGPVQAGLPQWLVRETAKAEATQAWGSLSGLWRWASVFAVAFSAAAILVGGAVLYGYRGRHDANELATCALGLALVPLVALGNLRGAALRGLGMVVRGQLPELVLRPAFLALVLLIALLVLPPGSVTSAQAMGYHAMAALAAFLVGAAMLAQAMPAELKAAAAQYEPRRWLGHVIPFALIAGMQLIKGQTDIVILGMFAPAEDVGVYRAAAQLAGLVAFGLMIVNMVSAPVIARLHARGEGAELQRVVSGAATAALFAALPIFAGLTFFAEAALRLAFGQAFAGGDVALIILCAGFLAHAAFGSVVLLLNMTGHERAVVRSGSWAIVANVVLNLALIPGFGKEGAALGSAVTLALWNVILWREVRAKLGIESSALPALRTALTRRAGP